MAAIKATAQHRLRTSAYAIGLQAVRCQTRADAVVLSGRVSSFYMKQLAQETIRGANDVCRIVNELEVDDWN